MYLEKFRIINFRAIEDITLNFNPGLNVLIGENNTGKTSIIDALRLCLGFGDQKRSIFVNKSDFRIDKNLKNEEFNDIIFKLTFKSNSNTEKACFVEMYNPKTDCLEINFKYSFKSNFNRDRIVYEIWGGENIGQQISYEVFHLFYHVYLGALRDAERYLRPGRNNKLGEFFSNIHYENLLKDDDSFGKIFDKEKMVANLNTSLEDSKDFIFLKNAKEQYIDEHFKKITFNNNPMPVDLKFLPLNFEDFVNNSKLLMPCFKETDNIPQKYLELNQNGLGYNNLLYIAILLGDLKDLKKIEDNLYIGLLIEEPEAHLHPQLQNLFFNYLNELNEKLNTEENHSFQIFISSHSPTLTSKADLSSLIVLQNIDKISNVSLKNSYLSLENEKYLKKFLDVTKSQLFFSKKIILVEGISEELLLPIFGDMMKVNFEKNGIEIVNLHGLNFKHLVPLFSSKLDNFEKTKSEGELLTSKCAIVTDKDPTEDYSESPTFVNLKSAENEDTLKVFGSKITFEISLFESNKDNLNVLQEIMEKIHRDLSKDELKCENLIKERNIKSLKNKLTKLDKSEYAWELAINLKDNEDFKNQFKIPDYIQEAINFVKK